MILKQNSCQILVIQQGKPFDEKNPEKQGSAMTDGKHYNIGRFVRRF